MKRFVKKHAGVLTWVFLPSLLLIASVISINMVSRPVVSNPGENCSLDADCTDSTGCFVEFCDTFAPLNGNCARSGVDTATSNQICLQCFTCGNGTCEQADSSLNPLEDINNCPQDCTIFGDTDVCNVFTGCNSTRDRCCPRACQGTNPSDSTFDADCCNGCGDNMISGIETCDGTAVKTGLTPPANGNTCRNDCTYCGDATVNGGEVCDPSTGSTACTVGGAAGVCNAQCQCIANCGNGSLDAGEECDPQLTGQPNFGCPVVGQTCNSLCQCSSICGDGTIDPGEECEPPNIGNCDANCQLIQVCGNGIVEPGEDCEGTTCNATINGEAIPGVCVACQCIPECQMEGSGCGDDGTGNTGVCFTGTGGTSGGGSLIPVGVHAGVLAQWLAAFAIPGAAFAGLKIRRRFKK